MIAQRIVVALLTCLIVASQVSAIGQPSAPAASDSSTPAAVPPAQPAVSPPTAGNASADALKLVLSGEEQKARELLKSAYDSGTRHLDADIPYFLAVFEAREGRLGAAIKYLTQTRELLPKQKEDDRRQQMLLAKRLGDCYYKDHKLENALGEYNIAILGARSLPDSGIVNCESLEGIVACEFMLKRYADAEKHSNALIADCRSRLRTGRIIDVLSYCWSLLQLADLYRESKQEAKVGPLQMEIRTLIGQLVEARMLADAEGRLPDSNQMIQDARKHYVDEMMPTSPAEIAWAANDFRVRTLPVIAWKNESPTPRAAIICIHGLGLENRAFTYMAKILNARGYLVYALDVRGFGAWTQTKGEEELNYAQTIADIATVTEAVKQRNPGIPVFVLGESMGGALALWAGSKLGQTIDGVISSVPSAERFQAKRMALQTAVHFIIDPKKPFNIGYEVTERATSEEELRAAWQKDPKARMGMTPVELMKFAAFMRLTKGKAEKITKLPVLVVQGLKDRLVKPEGTFDLFQAVKSEDKTILVIGTAEHLMFENMSPDPLLIDTVESWLKYHIASNR